MAQVSLARKKELNEPDEFITLSNKALEYSRQNKSMIMSVVIGALALIIVISGYQYYAQSRGNKAFAQYASDMAWYETALKEKKGDVPLKDVKEKGDSFLGKYAGTTAAMLAQAKYAGIYFKEKDFSAAEKLYNDLLSESKPGTALRNISLCALAQCYEAMDKTDQAVARYQELLSGENEIKKDEALFHLGLIYEKKGDQAQSRDAYSRLAKEFSDSMYVEMAKEKVDG
ncbi:MAG: tetratricopeptide repeat protein [Proteobacteria bacterium]|nr:tetratricopeptide repeat protein [Pseudomonadota bacterium]